MKTEIGKQYCVTCDSACDIVDTATGNTIHHHHAGEAQSYFTAIGIDSEPSDDTAVVTEVFKSAPAGNGGGGYIESNLNVGHGASAAVAAQCTLTPGADLDIGGTLEHNGSVVELEDQFSELDIAVSHPEYGGKLEVTDGDGQTLYTFDTPAAPGDFASIVLTFAQGWELESIEFALDKGDGDTLELAYSWEGDFSLDDFVEFLNSGAEGSLGDFAEARPWAAGIKITLKDPAFAGAAGNAVSYVYYAMSPFTNEDGETFSGGGENARGLAGLVEAMQDDDAPVEVEVNAGNDGVLLTSRVGGAAGAYNVVNAEGGDLWLGVDDSLAIAIPRTPEDLAGAIEEDLTLMELASASVSDGKIVLTAPTTPTATQYNNMEYTATGCFGGGSVKQGSTTRGKNAVEQTAFKIYLNGAELDVEPAPLPEALTPTTAMRNGGVYTVEADGAEMDFSDVTVADYATAKLRLYYGDATSFTWPSWIWMTEDGYQPNFEYFKRYQIVLENDGSETVAIPVSSYAVHPEFEHEELTAQNRADTSLQLYLITSETSLTGGAWIGGEPGPQQAFDKTGHSKLYTGFNTIAQGNLDGDETWTPQNTPTGAEYSEFNRWRAITFCTALPLTVHAFSVQSARGNNNYEQVILFEALVDDVWVELARSFELPPPMPDEDILVWKDYVLKVDSPVEASKYRILFGFKGGFSSRFQSVRIFEK